MTRTLPASHLGHRQAEILSLIAEADMHGQPFPPRKVIARSLGISRCTARNLVQKLIEKGWIERRNDLHLTGRARAELSSGWRATA